MTVKYTPMKTTWRIIFNCQCGITRAFDYQRTGGKDIRFYRMDGNQEIYSHTDSRCSCGKKVKETFVHGHLNKEHKCDPRCTHAKGSDCSCECGGENHGRGWII